MHIDVRTEFNACVRGLNGVVLDDVLKNPNFPNADYWFPEHQVVGELKCLTENLTSKREFNQRISKLYSSWVHRGLLPRSGHERVTLSLRDIPVRCAREFLDPVKRRLEVNTLKKANSQIKATKKHFNAPNAKGLLLLVNDGDYMFPPGMMAHLIARATKVQHASINSVIYFSVNETVSVPGIPEPSLFWVDALLPEREPVPSALRKLIQEAWMAHHSRLLPGFIYELAMKNDADVVDNIQFTRSSES